MFSMRDYSVHKFALESDRVVADLVKFHSIVIKHDEYPSRWLKVVDVMLEKGKVPRFKIENFRNDRGRFTISDENIFRSKNE